MGPRFYGFPFVQQTNLSWGGTMSGEIYLLGILGNILFPSFFPDGFPHRFFDRFFRLTPPGIHLRQGAAPSGGEVKQNAGIYFCNPYGVIHTFDAFRGKPPPGTCQAKLDYSQRHCKCPTLSEGNVPWRESRY